MGAWVIGHNLDGYLPEADTEVYETREDAMSAFIAMAEDYAATDDEHAWDAIHDGIEPADDEYPCMSLTVASILKDDGPNAPDLAGRDYVMSAEDRRGRRIVFWMQWSDQLNPGARGEEVLYHKKRR
jgi:hypothetical protein